jgi:hypothetical protein
MLRSILNDEPLRPRKLNPAVSVELQRIVLKTLEKDRMVRYQSAAELRNDLDRLRSEQWSSARWALVIASALVFELGVVLGGVKLGWFGILSTTPELIPRQITANPLGDPVKIASISPDGAYVAYNDLAGIHVRRIDTGQTHLIPPPNEEYCFR